MVFGEALGDLIVGPVRAIDCIPGLNQYTRLSNTQRSTFLVDEANSVGEEDGAEAGREDGGGGGAIKNVRISLSGKTLKNTSGKITTKTISTTCTTSEMIIVINRLAAFDLFS